MKKIYSIFMLLFLVGCSNSNENTLDLNSTINHVFQKSEINDLSKILRFFNHQICANEKLDTTATSKCYQAFFKRMAKAAETGNLDLKISFEAQLQLYTQISDSTFNQIWSFGRSWDHKSTDTLKHIAYNYKGKYIQFLKEVGKDIPEIKDYLEAFETGGDIDPSMVAQLLLNHESYDIADKRVQLIIAIHYLTMNDQFYRKEKYNEQKASL